MIELVVVQRGVFPSQTRSSSSPGERHLHGANTGQRNAPSTRNPGPGQSTSTLFRRKCKQGDAPAPCRLKFPSACVPLQDIFRWARAPARVRSTRGMRSARAGHIVMQGSGKRISPLGFFATRREDMARSPSPRLPSSSAQSLESRTWADGSRREEWRRNNDADSAAGHVTMDTRKGERLGPPKSATSRTAIPASCP